MLDICAIAKPWECQDCFDSGIRKGIFDRHLLQHILEVESKPGRTGIRLFRSLLAERGLGESPGSVLASRFLRELRKRRFPEPTAEFRVSGPGLVRDLDFAYPEMKIGFQVDGYAFHASKRAFDDDRDSDTVLIGLGWSIFRITHAALASPNKSQRLFDSIRSRQHQLSAKNRSTVPQLFAES